MARNRRVTKSAVVREALAAFVAVGMKSSKGSVLDLAWDLVGCVEGPADLSVNEDHLLGYGR